MKYNEVAASILEAIGSSENLVSATHCATRLRLVLKNEEAVDQAALDAQPAVKGFTAAGGQFQIVIGAGEVDTVYQAFMSLVDQPAAAGQDRSREAAGPKLLHLVRVLSDIFVPIIPALVGGGLMLALHNVLTSRLIGERSLAEMLPAITGLTELINLLAAAPFAFLPILIGFSAAKRFGGNPYLGATLGMAMVMPSLTSGYSVGQALADGSMKYWDIFGLNVAQAGYQGSVLPILVMSFVLAKLEKFFRKILKGTFEFIFAPLLTLLVTGLITFIVTGPLLRTAGDQLTSGLQWLYSAAGPLGGLLFGGLYSPIVITGLHQSFPAIELQLIAQGGSFIFAIASVANIAQGAACLAVLLTTRDRSVKSISGAASLSALLGITEPAMFGVNLRLRYPFFIALGAAAVGGFFISLFQVTAISLGAAGVMGFVSIKAAAIVGFLVSCAISFAVAFTVTFLYARMRQPKTYFVAPLSGRVQVIAEVNDPIIAQGKLGQGLAIIPQEDLPVQQLLAPIDGTVSVVFPSGHAYGIKAKDGTELLLHIGINTIELKGNNFTPQVKKGKRVKAGDVLAEFSPGSIRQVGYDPTTVITVMNSEITAKVSQLPQQFTEVTAGQRLL